MCMRYWVRSAHRLTVSVASVLAFSTTVAAADTVVLGIGVDNLDATGANEAGAFQLEYHAEPMGQLLSGDLALMGVAQADADGDVFVGGGLSLTWQGRGKWFVESSLAAGYYDAGSDGLDLGGNVMFRTLLGVGYAISDTSRISLAVDHLSNAGLETVNPGRNAVHVRYGFNF